MNTLFLIVATIIVTIGLSIILVCLGTINWTEEDLNDTKPKPDSDDKEHHTRRRK